MTTDSTTISVTAETWRELNSRKNPGESFDSVLARMLEQVEGGE